MASRLQFFVGCLCALLLSANAADELLACVQVYRHGQRTPVIHYKNDPYNSQSYWPTEPGQLVNEGKQQHYKLGKFTRARYSDLLTTQYHSTQFYAQTTNVDRTHMSAQSNLAALWEPSGSQVWDSTLSWQPIPVHPSDTNVLTQTCSTTDTKVNNVVLNSDLFAAINEEFADTYKLIAEGSGESVTNVMSIWLIRDTLFIEELNGYTLPSWTSAVYPEPMDTLASYAFLANSYTDDLKKINTGLFFRDMVNYFEKMLADPTSSYKFKMYSAHDTNVAAILNTLGAFTPHSPYYASSIYFELRRNSNGRGYINIWYKNDDDFDQITVKGCTLNCSLSIFKSLMSSYIIDDDDFTALCTASTINSTVSTYGLALDDDIDEAVEKFLNVRNQ